MALESGSFIGNLVATNPTGADSKSQGDDHIRLIKGALLNCFAGFTGSVIVTGTDGGVANTYTVTPATAVPSYVTKMIVLFSPTNTNTGASTINISGLGTREIRTVDGLPLSSGDLVLGSVYVATLSGTEFRLLYVTKNYVDQLSFSSSLPAQSLGFLISNGSVASFSKKHVGYAQDEVRGADIASATTVNLQTATGNLVHITGTTTITAVTLDSGAEREVVFDGILTLTNGASLVLPTGANIVTAAGDCVTFRGEPSSVVRVTKYTRADGRSLAITPLGDHEIVVHTGNGFGSTNTAIRRFTTTLTSVGTAITYADSATLGGSFTINETGLYSIYHSDESSVAVTIGVSNNSTQLSTNILSINVADRVAIGNLVADTNLPSSISRTLKLTSGDVIRAHGSTAANSTSNRVSFAIRKIGAAP